MSPRFIPRGALQLDPNTSEPYLTLPAPHSNIRITPIRVTEHDIDAQVRVFTDPLVYPFLHGPPFPYTRADAVNFLSSERAEYNALTIAEPGENVGYASVSPVHALREVQPDGSDVWVGNVSIMRYDFAEVTPQEERKRVYEANEAKAAGDPTIVWGFGGERFLFHLVCHAHNDVCRRYVTHTPWSRNHDERDTDYHARLGHSLHECTHYPGNGILGQYWQSSHIPQERI